MNLQLHATGSSFIAMDSEHNPRDIVVDLITKHPNTDRKELFLLFCEEIEINPEHPYQRAVAWYFFVNIFGYITESRAPHERRSKQAARQERLVEQYVQQIVLLDFPMINGKLLGDCTGAELFKMGSRYHKLADRIGKAKTPREVLTEDQVKKILA